MRKVRLVFMASVTFLLIFFGIRINAFAESIKPTVSIDQVTSEPNTTVKVHIRIKDNSGICGAALTVSYDSKLKLVSISTGNAFTTLAMTKPGDLSANPFNIIWDGMEENTQDGTIAELTFSTPSEAGEYGVYATYDRDNILDGDLNPVEIKIINGSIEVENAFQKKVTGICLNQNSIAIPAGKTEKLEYTIIPSDATNRAVTWKSSNDKIATVDNQGIITGKKEGTVTVTASSVEGNKTAVCRVRILFSDVVNKNYVGYTAIYDLADQGIVAGYGDVFKPNNNVTRGQVVLFLWRAAGKPKPKATKLTFKDTSDIEALAKDYKTAILWASEKGIVKGYTTGVNAGKFKPNDACTRGQIVTFLWRYKGQPAPKAGKVNNFPDVPSSHSFYKAISWAASYGITTGFSDGKFKPGNTCTRGQCVTFLFRMLK